MSKESKRQSKRLHIEADIKHASIQQSQQAVSPQADGIPSERLEHATVSLFQLQRQVGNRALTSILAKPSDHKSFKLDNETLSKVIRKRDSSTQRSTTASVMSQIFPNIAPEGAIMTKAGKGAKPDNGTVTIQPVKFDYYDVTGSTLAEIAPQLDPEEWGHCDAQYEYSYEATVGRATRVDIILTPTIRLPRLQVSGEKPLSPKAQKEWDRMLTALKTHENNHDKIARRRASVIRNSLVGKKESQLGDKFEKAVGKAQKAHDKYDKKTQNGKTEGVKLDLSIE
jgi:predicted secreted Zn-dependent protease